MNLMNGTNRSERKLLLWLRLSVAVASVGASLFVLSMAGAQETMRPYDYNPGDIDTSMLYAGYPNKRASGPTILRVDSGYVLVTRGGSTLRFRASDLTPAPQGSAHRSPRGAGRTGKTGKDGDDVDATDATAAAHGLDGRRRVGAGDLSFHENPVSGNPGPQTPLNNRGLTIGTNLGTKPTESIGAVGKAPVGVGTTGGDRITRLRSPFVGTDPMTVSGDTIYIVHGNTLYRLRASDMTVTAKRALPL